MACHPKPRAHRAPGGGWSGRRGSNPRPTAWKAVTLPLSYSRLRAHARHSFALRRASPPLFPTAAHLRVSPIFATHSGGRRLVAREGLEPSKPLGRQIYSLLRLTASLPRLVFSWQTWLQDPDAQTREPEQSSPQSDLPCLSILFFAAGPHPAVRRCDDSPTRPRTWSWRRDLNPRPADYKSAALPD